MDIVRKTKQVTRKTVNKLERAVGMKRRSAAGRKGGRASTSGRAGKRVTRKRASTGGRAGKRVSSSRRRK